MDSGMLLYWLSKIYSVIHGLSLNVNLDDYTFDAVFRILDTGSMNRCTLSFNKKG